MQDKLSMCRMIDLPARYIYHVTNQPNLSDSDMDKSTDVRTLHRIWKIEHLCLINNLFMSAYESNGSIKIDSNAIVL